jgi:hypothetical protein
MSAKHGPMALLVRVALAAASVAFPGHGWPTDDEGYGLMGCRFFQFNGEWERMENPDDPEENTVAACVSVAMASIINYHRWPPESHFDGLYVKFGGFPEIKPIFHRWDYGLISGNGDKSAECDSDLPEGRYSIENPEWTGEDEIHELIYVVERSFGASNDWLRTTDNSCYGLGHYAIEHILKNRFGYPAARTMPAKKGETKKHVIRNLDDGLPVIALKCDHAFVIDGYRAGRKDTEGRFHSCDYVSGDATMGWFKWSRLIEDYVEHFVVDLSPVYTIRRGQPEVKIAYHWGEGCVAFTGNTQREGYITVDGPDDGPLGSIGAELRIQQEQGPGSVSTTLAGFATAPDGSMRIPEVGRFSFHVGRRTKIVLRIFNADRRAKQLKIIFHDFEVRRDT